MEDAIKYLFQDDEGPLARNEYIANILWEIERGCLREVERLMDGIPKGSNFYHYDYYLFSKIELELIREELKIRLTSVLKSRYGKECDHYFRELSALKYLGISKDSELIPKEGNAKYEVAYRLWVLENGDPVRFEILSSLSWLCAEYAKKEYGRVLEGYHHDTYAKKRRKLHLKELKEIFEDENIYEKAKVEEIIDGICQKLTETTMTIVEYVRYFHLLTLMGVPRNSSKVPSTSQNMRYNIAYYLWALDVEMDIEWEKIMNIAMYCEEL